MPNINCELKDCASSVGSSNLLHMLEGTETSLAEPGRSITLRYMLNSVCVCMHAAKAAYLGASHGEEAPHDKASCQQAGPVHTVGQQPYGNQGCSIKQLQQAQPQTQHTLTAKVACKSVVERQIHADRSCKASSNMHGGQEQLLAKVNHCV